MRIAPRTMLAGGLARVVRRRWTVRRIFLPLIAVNCAILGGSLFMVERDYGIPVDVPFAELLPEHLEGDAPTGGPFLGLVDRPHAPGAEQSE